MHYLCILNVNVKYVKITCAFFFLNREHLVAGKLFCALIGPEKQGLSAFFRQEEQRFVLN